MELRVDQTPNPNAIKFTASESLFEGSTSLKQGQETDNAFAKALLELEGVDNIFGYGDFVTVNKTGDADWETLIPKVQDAYQKTKNE
ncbi:NifU N-terminal domain-containing protein [Bacillus piscicola]|uniref:NifU N-terminal domain-containing protein n=1 Tax=Bacillus piscicola TaxID=1632684 RepID=UPI001F09D61C|nr:NifU N-terminal domain-containing protein [Bacillus piscicola]